MRGLLLTRGPRDLGSTVAHTGLRGRPRTAAAVPGGGPGERLGGRVGGFWVGALEGGLEAPVYSCLCWLHRGGGRRHCVWGVLPGGRGRGPWWAAWWRGQEATLQGWVSSVGVRGAGAWVMAGRPDGRVEDLLRFPRFSRGVARGPPLPCSRHLRAPVCFLPCVWRLCFICFLPSCPRWVPCPVAGSVGRLLAVTCTLGCEASCSAGQRPRHTPRGCVGRGPAPWEQTRGRWPFLEKSATTAQCHRVETRDGPPGCFGALVGASVCPRRVAFTATEDSRLTLNTLNMFH